MLDKPMGGTELMYEELMKRLPQEYKDKANAIYKQIFNEDVVYSCCMNKAYIKLDHYVRNTLKLL